MRCREDIYSARSLGRCGNSAKYDLVEGVLTKCGVHCKAAVAKRQVKMDARNVARNAEWDAADARHEAERSGDVLIEELLMLIEDQDSSFAEIFALVPKIREQQKLAEKP